MEERLREVVKAFRTTPLREALRVASPALASALEDPARAAEDPARIGPALMRYLERMRGRSTPFGLCAGYAVGLLSRETRPLMLAPTAEYRKIARLDVDIVASVASRRAQQQASDREELIASREILRLTGTLRLARRNAGGEVVHEDIARSPALDAVLAATEEPRALAEILDVLGPFADEADRRAYVQALIEHGLLVPAAGPPLTTRTEISYLGDTRLGELARHLRNQPIGERTDEAQAELEEALVPFRSSANDAAVIFDLVKPLSDGALGEEVVRASAQLVSVLSRLGRPARDRRLAKLRAFLESRYEGRAVSLVEALDPDRGFAFPVAPEYERRDHPRRAQIVQDLYERALRGGLHEVELDEATLPRGEVEYPRDAFAARFSLVLADGGVELWDPSFVPAPGTQLFARATAFDDELHALTQSYLAAQARAFPGSDIADVAYFVPGKSASFVQLPPLQPFEIPLTARSGVPAAQRIDIHDLLIRCEADEMVITSRRTGRRVRPRIVGAMNGNRPDVTSVARFLCALAGEEAVPRFHWGALERASFLPRVRFGRHVLCSATWNLRAADMAPLRAARGHETAFEEVQVLRHRRGLPRHVLHDEANVLLPVDLDDRLSVAAWLDVARGDVRLIEALPRAGASLRGPEGSYHHEIVLPFLPSGPPVPCASPSLPAFADHQDRRAPGGDVLFLKLHGDRRALVSMVTDTLRPLIAGARAEGLITHWFFLPYSDPDPHVRLRLFGRPEVLWGNLLPRIHAALKPPLDAGSLHRIVLDTYDRETYRYGGPEGLDIVERVFSASSEAAVIFHEEGSLDEDDENRWMTRVVISHLDLLAATGLTLEEQAHQAKLTAARYRRARDPAEPRRRAGKIFREIQAALSPGAGRGGFPEELARHFAALRSCASVRTKMAEIVADCMHVHSVRLLTTWHETPHLEEIGYLILEKALRGRLARRAPPADLTGA
ncbi:Lanthionine biosynthesis protein LanB [Minicystis rosea]|nr:Lanthionine biosynthesis protein LanB [Minicystis rosea]